MFTHRQTSRLKVLHVVGDSKFGGVATIILGLCRTAQEEGWEPDVLCTDPAVQKAVRQQGLGVVDLDVIRRPIRPVWDLGGLFRLRAFLRRQPYHIVHTHTSKGGFVGRLAARLAGVPIVVHTAHGFAFHEHSPAAVRRLYTGLERLASRWCDRIVSVSEFHRDWALQLKICGPEHIVAIPNGIVPAARSPQFSPAELRRQLRVGPEDMLILSVARLASDKGLNFLIEAVGMLPQTGRIHLAIAGDGPARDRLLRMAGALDGSRPVHFLGFREDIGDLLAACDVVVLPSLREGLSISLLEAMAAGKPIIATAIGSQREVAAHGEMACLVPPADATALKDAILRLARDSVLRVRLAANAQAIYGSDYTEERMLRDYRRLYLELVRTAGPLPSAVTEEPASGFAELAPPLRDRKGGRT
jgi:glycosyltransferase involved in cell wall biosynthesis